MSKWKSDELAGGLAVVQDVVAAIRQEVEQECGSGGGHGAQPPCYDALLDNDVAAFDSDRQADSAIVADTLDAVASKFNLPRVEHAQTHAGARAVYILANVSGQQPLHHRLGAGGMRHSCHHSGSHHGEYYVKLRRRKERAYMPKAYHCIIRLSQSQAETERFRELAKLLYLHREELRHFHTRIGTQLEIGLSGERWYDDVASL